MPSEVRVSLSRDLFFRFLLRIFNENARRDARPCVSITLNKIISFPLVSQSRPITCTLAIPSPKTAEYAPTWERLF